MNHKHTKNNVVIALDLTNKEKYKMDNGVEIAIERGHNFNYREDKPSFATCVSAENIPSGAEILVHHNSHHDSFKLFGNEEKNIFSVSEDSVYCWKKNSEDTWHPCKGFLISLRLFKPYKGFLVGIEDEKIEQRLYIVRGKFGDRDLSGKVAVVLKNADYQIIYHDEGKIANVIRTRERELIGIDIELTEKVKAGEIKLGYETKDAKFINEYSRTQISH